MRWFNSRRRRAEACSSEDQQATLVALKPMAAMFLWTSYLDHRFVHILALEVPEKLEQIITQPSDRVDRTMVGSARQV